MDAAQVKTEQCGNCRFWEAGSTECRRHAPVLLHTLGQVASPASDGQHGTWPHTDATGWCGEWSQRGEAPAAPSSSRVPVYDDLAAMIFLQRLDPSLELPNATEVLAVLLNQLRPDIRKVIIRAHGLDGLPLEGLKGVARELKMDRSRVQSLLTAGEQRLAKIFQTFAVSHSRKD